MAKKQKKTHGKKHETAESRRKEMIEHQRKLYKH